MRKFPRKASALIQEAERLSFSISATHGGPAICPSGNGEHVFAASTPGCPRAFANARAKWRRVAAEDRRYFERMWQRSTASPRADRLAPEQDGAARIRARPRIPPWWVKHRLREQTQGARG
jgi:hypothetical protein